MLHYEATPQESLPPAHQESLPPLSGWETINWIFMKETLGKSSSWWDSKQASHQTPAPPCATNGSCFRTRKTQHKYWISACKTKSILVWLLFHQTCTVRFLASESKARPRSRGGIMKCWHFALKPPGNAWNIQTHHGRGGFCEASHSLRHRSRAQETNHSSWLPHKQTFKK